MTGQLALFDATTMQSWPRLRLVPTGPRLGDRRAPARLDPQGHRGLEDGNADVIIRGWGRLVADVPVTLAGAL